MKLIIEKEILVKNLESVTKALSTRNIIPVLNGIKFDLKKSGLYLTASDNDISIESFVDKKYIKSIEEDGCVIIYGKSLLEILKKLPNVDLLIENFENNEISFKTSSSEYKFNCFKQEDFPNIKFEEIAEPIILDSLKFKEFINKTSFACSLQESRPLLTGVNIKIIGNIFECIATDSYRLSRIQIELDKAIENNFNIVIPARNINEMCRIITEEKPIEIHPFNNKILFKYGNIKFQSSLLNGTYPNTDNSIPKEFKNKLLIDLKEFYNIIDRASLVTQSKEKNIIELEILDNILIIRASSNDIGKIEEKLEINNISKNNIKISFSAKYMLDALKIFNKDKILLLLNGEISPIILNEEQNKEVTELILPMKTY